MLELFGDRIKLIREGMGLSQAQFAEKVGYSQPGISQIERGVRRVCGRTLKRFADRLAIPEHEIVGLSAYDVHLRLAMQKLERLDFSALVAISAVMDLLPQH
jgi:transcriptional regulator with XRE-family HTH domain